MAEGTMTKAVFLDLDNTLYRYGECNTAALKKVMQFLSGRCGISLKKAHVLFGDSRKGVKKRLRDTASSHSRLLYFKALVEKATGKTDPRLCLAAEELFWREYLKRMMLLPEARRFLGYCRKRRKKIIIITDLTAQIQLRKILRLGITNSVDRVITSEEMGKDKPHPSLYRAALQYAGCRPSEAIMIGDNIEKDVRGAQRLKIRVFSSFERARRMLESEMKREC